MSSATRSIRLIWMVLRLPALALLACLAPLPLRAQPRPASKEVTLPAGSRISVRLAQSLDTKRDGPGARFLAHVDLAVTRNGEVVVPKGAVCHGHLTDSRSSGRLKGRAVMRLSLDSFESNGRSYAISTYQDSRVSASHKKRNIGLIGGGAGAGAAIGAIAGGGAGALIGAGAGAAAGTTGAALTGKRDIHLPAETRLTFILKQPVTVRR